MWKSQSNAKAKRVEKGDIDYYKCYVSTNSLIYSIYQNNQKIQQKMCLSFSSIITKGGNISRDHSMDTVELEIQDVYAT